MISVMLFGISMALAVGFYFRYELDDRFNPGHVDSNRPAPEQLLELILFGITMLAFFFGTFAMLAYFAWGAALTFGFMAFVAFWLSVGHQYRQSQRTTQSSVSAEGDAPEPGHDQPNPTPREHLRENHGPNQQRR